MNITPISDSRCERALVWVLPAAAWTTFAPIGLKYLAFLATTALSIAVMQQRKLWFPAWRQIGPALLLAWVALNLTSALWSPAALSRIGSHLWIYALPLSTIVISAACPPWLAQRALAHFCIASGCVGGLWFAYERGNLVESALWQTTLAASGNQRIASSVLLGLGAAIACWMATRQPSLLRKSLFLLAALLATAGLVSQDRRSGMLLLPLLLLAWTAAAPRPTMWRAAWAGTVALAAAGVWFGSETVRGRLMEGYADLSTYSSSAPAVTSWGMRVRMFEITSDMVGERPVFGHGLGSWQLLWDQRVAPGTRLADNSTPHNEYLLVASQAGVLAAVLLLAWLLAMIAFAVRAGALGIPGLMAWLTFALVGLANAVLRDAKFALPLLLLAALATALGQSSPRKPGARPALRDN